MFPLHRSRHYCAGTLDGICPSVAQHAQHVVAVAASPLRERRRRRRRHRRQLLGATGRRQCSFPAQQPHPASAVTARQPGTQKQQRHAGCSSLEILGSCLLGPGCSCFLCWLLRDLDMRHEVHYSLVAHMFHVCTRQAVRICVQASHCRQSWLRPRLRVHCADGPPHPQPPASGPSSTALPSGPPSSGSANLIPELTHCQNTQMRLRYFLGLLHAFLTSTLSCG